MYKKEVWNQTFFDFFAKTNIIRGVYFMHYAMKEFKKHLKSNLKILMTAIAVVMVWWAVWGLLDQYFIPQNKPLGYLIGFLIGILILLLDDWLIDELWEGR